MSVTTHERPGVYSAYDASSVVQRHGRGERWWGWRPSTPRPRQEVPQTVTSYEGALIAFGSTGEQDMTELIRLALKNGAGRRGGGAGGRTRRAMRTAFAALAAMEDIGVVICDSADREVQQALRDSVAAGLCQPAGSGSPWPPAGRARRWTSCWSGPRR